MYNGSVQNAKCQGARPTNTNSGSRVSSHSTGEATPHLHLLSLLLRSQIVMPRPDSKIKPPSFDSSKREAYFFNPALGPPPPVLLTPGLTPFPGTNQHSSAGRAKSPWVVSPPPPVLPKTAPGVVEADSSRSGWFKRKSWRSCSWVLAFLLAAVLFFVALGAYVVLVYLAVTTQKPKYIAFSSCLGGVFLVIILNVLTSGRPDGESHAPGGRERTESEHDEEIRKAYGLRSNWD